MYAPPLELAKIDTMTISTTCATGRVHEVGYQDCGRASGLRFGASNVTLNQSSISCLS